MKSREENSNLIKGSVYSAKVNLSNTYNPSKALKTSDLGNGYHIFTEQGKKK
ncbi:MAG: hypothetical protein ING88_14920 [Cytophagales bacterium]|nr:hypothetical protein [Cytophagales bacterium]